MEIATAHFALSSHHRAVAKRGQAALNFWFFWFKPEERKKRITVLTINAKYFNHKGRKEPQRESDKIPTIHSQARQTAFWHRAAQADCGVALTNTFSQNKQNGEVQRLILR